MMSVGCGQAALVGASLAARHVIVSIEAERFCDLYHHTHAPGKRHACMLPICVPVEHLTS